MQIFLDGMLISSRLKREYIEHLRPLLEHRLFGTLSKGSFFQREIYCGHIISEEAILIDLAKIEAIMDQPTLKNAHVVHSFWGFVGPYRSSMKEFPKSLALLPHYH